MRSFRVQYCGDQFGPDACVEELEPDATVAVTTVDMNWYHTTYTALRWRDEVATSIS